MPSNGDKERKEGNMGKCPRVGTSPLCSGSCIDLRHFEELGSSKGRREASEYWIIRVKCSNLQAG